MKYVYIFIGGLHRSGTTPLCNVLRGNPGISGFSGTGVSADEGQHLQTVFYPAYRYGGPGVFCFSPGAVLDEHSALLTEANKLRLRQEWEIYWDRNSPFRVEKSPPNLIRTRFLQAVFPQSYFITLIRHPLAVAFATQKLRNLPLYDLIRHWLLGYRIYRAHRVKLQRHMVIRYESLVEHSRESLVQLSRFLGVNLDASICNLRPDINADYFSLWERFREDSKNRESCRRILDDFEERVAEFGYSLKNPWQQRPGCLDYYEHHGIV